MILAALVTLATLALPGTARAQSAEAEALFNQADQLMRDGKLAEACEAFDASNRIEPRAGTMIRLGDCRERQGKLASAWSAYRDSLTRVKDPRKKRIASQRAKALEARLSQVTLVVPDASRIDGLEVQRNGVAVDPGLWNRAFPIDGGDHVFSAGAQGHLQWIATVSIPIEKGKVTVEVPRLEPAPVEPPPPDLAPVDVDREPDVAPVERPRRGIWSGKRKLAVGIAGVAAAAIGTGVFLGISAKGLEDDAFALCPDPAMSCAEAGRANELIDRAGSRALLANVAFGVGGLAAVGAAVLWFTGAPEAEPRLGLAPRVAPGYAGVSLGGRF